MKTEKEIIKNKSVDNIIVIHDDIDLPIGKIKIDLINSIMSLACQSKSRTRTEFY